MHVLCEFPGKHYVIPNHTECTFTRPEYNELGMFNPATEPLQHFQKLVTATSWLKDLRSQKTWNHNVIDVITRNVASKQYCLLQVLVAALLLLSCAAFVKRCPDPLNCTKHYLRIDDKFYNLTCPNDVLFDQYKEQCTLEDCKPLNLTWFNGTDCSLNMPSRYCEPDNRFA